MALASLPWRLALATSSPDEFCSRFQPFELGNQPPPPILQRRKRLQLAVDVQAALLQPSTDLFLMLADESRIQHGEILP